MTTVEQQKKKYLELGSTQGIRRKHYETNLH